MKKRIKLADRTLPRYSRGEEKMNMITHIVGGGIGVIVLILCIIRSVLRQNTLGIVSSGIYGFAMVGLYTISGIYHGLRPSTGKKVMQVLDHCTIYLLIAGTYTPILLCAFLPVYPVLAISLLVLQWGLGALASTLTAIDLKKYSVFSMICYILMGWCIIFFVSNAIQVLTMPGFLLLLSGGIAYTIGAVLFGIGVRIKWMHSVFHIFVVIGSILQFLAILFYVL